MSRAFLPLTFAGSEARSSMYKYEGGPPKRKAELSSGGWAVCIGLAKSFVSFFPYNGSSSA